MSDASPIPPAAATDITRTSHLRWPIFALIAMGLTGLGGTGYYFIYQKEEIATRRRQDASPVAYFQSRQNGEQPTNEAEEAELASSLEMPEAPADVATSVASNLVTENVASTPAPNEQALAEATDNAQASTDVLDRMAAQEQKIEALEARLDAAEQEMQGLSDALAQSAASGSDEAASSDRADLLIQFYRVRQRAINAQPFSEALAILLNMDGLDGESYAALGTLQGISEEGMPSSLELKKQFNRSLQDYLSREVSPTQSGGLWADMRDRLGSLVHVRKVGAQHRGDDDASIIARSEAFIETQALDKAVKEMAMLSGDAAPHFHQWRMQARQRLKTLATFKTLEQRLQRGR